jgi:iron only hydrogenase large subunit-like protein
VDHVITTAEIGKIFLDRGIKLNELPESEFDCLVGEGTGGAVLFGTTGGVMEAALRTVYEQVSAELFGDTAATGTH